MSVTRRKSEHEFGVAKFSFLDVIVKKEPINDDVLDVDNLDNLENLKPARKHKLVKKQEQEIIK